MDRSLTVKAVIAYEDLRAGLRAKEIADRLAEQCEGTFELTNAWRFELLGHQTMREWAALDAASADILLLGLSCGALPDAVEQWLESWFSRKTGQAAALVAVIDPEEQRSFVTSPLRNHLESLAADAGIDFLYPSEESEANQKSAEARWARNPPSLGSPPRWGINE